MDVDGVLTDGRIYFFPDASGNMVESKTFDSQDGIALRWCQWKGIRTGVISGRDSAATVARASRVDTDATSSRATSKKSQSSNKSDRTPASQRKKSHTSAMT